MVTFYLPGFTHNHVGLYEYILCLKEKRPEYFMDFKVGAFYDSFPPSIWNGGRLTEGFVSCVEVKQIIKHVNDMGISMRYTFSNTELEKTDVYDRYCNNIMEFSNNGKNDVIVASPILEKYLRKKYPNFKYILSTTRHIDNLKDINKLTKKYDFVIPSYEKNCDIDFFKKIKDKDKIEILVNAACAPDCLLKKEHYKIISLGQLGKVDYCDIKCKAEQLSIKYKYECKYKTYLSPDVVWNTLVPMGFTHFKIRGREFQTAEKLIYEVLKYLVKPEYFEMLFNKILKLYT